MKSIIFQSMKWSKPLYQNLKTMFKNETLKKIFNKEGGKILNKILITVKYINWTVPGVKRRFNI